MLLSSIEETQEVTSHTIFGAVSGGVRAAAFCLTGAGSFVRFAGRFGRLAEKLVVSELIWLPVIELKTGRGRAGLPANGFNPRIALGSGRKARLLSWPIRIDAWMHVSSVLTR